MSRIKSVDKSETNVIYTLSKDNDFLKQMTEVLVKLRLQDKKLHEFPVKLEKEDEFYNQIRDTNKNITIVFATNNIFVIASGSEDFIKEFNKSFDAHFSF